MVSNSLIQKIIFKILYLIFKHNFKQLKDLLYLDFLCSLLSKAAPINAAIATKIANSQRIEGNITPIIGKIIIIQMLE